MSRTIIGDPAPAIWFSLVRTILDIPLWISGTVFGMTDFVWEVHPINVTIEMAMKNKHTIKCLLIFKSPPCICMV
jgi:hypothetical protein